MKAIYNKQYYLTQIIFKGGSTAHLKKLKQEVDEAIADPDDIEEYSDCLLTLFAAVSSAGYTYEEFMKAATAKQSILEKRKWQRMSDGTYQHCKQTIT